MAPFAHVFRQECIRAKKSGLRSLWLQLEICERIGLDLDKAFVADVLRVHHSNSKSPAPFTTATTRIMWSLVSRRLRVVNEG
jgi:hypothetical protein